jgi:hypothetical protein
MSEENVEIVQAAIETWNAGNMAAADEQFHPDVIAWHRRIGRSQDRS